MTTASTLSWRAFWRICLVTLSDVCFLLFYAATLISFYLLVGGSLARAYLIGVGGAENLVFHIFLVFFSPLALAFLVFLWWVPLQEWEIAHPLQERRLDDPELERKINLRVYPGNPTFWHFTFSFFLPVLVNGLSLLLKDLGLNWWSELLFGLRFHSWWISVALFALLLFAIFEVRVSDWFLAWKSHYGDKRSATN